MQDPKHRQMLVLMRMPWPPNFIFLFNRHTHTPKYFYFFYLPNYVCQRCGGRAFLQLKFPGIESGRILFYIFFTYLAVSKILMKLCYWSQMIGSVSLHHSYVSLLTAVV